MQRSDAVVGGYYWLDDFANSCTAVVAAESAASVASVAVASVDFLVTMGSMKPMGPKSLLS